MLSAASRASSKLTHTLGRTLNRKAASSAIGQRLLRTVPIPADLGSITDIDTRGEVPAEAAGLHQHDVDAIWSSVEDLYCTGYYPAILFCVRRNGHMILNRAMGYARGFGELDAAGAAQETDEPELVTTNTPACLYSASKAVTAMLIHKLADEGLINLLDPVAHYLPEFGQHGKDRITLFHILAHRGGVPGIPASEHFTNLGDHARQWALICDARPIDAHGRTSAYHAITGGTILQAVLEKVTGQRITHYWNQHFKKPLGLRYFGYGANQRDFALMARDQVTGAKVPKRVRTYFRQYLGMDVETESTMFNDFRFYEKPIPAGNMVATAEESNRFFQMLLDQGRYQGKQIVSPLAIRRATQEVGPHEFDRVLKLPLRCSPGMMLGGAPYGLYGPHTGQAFGHVGLINTFIWADPERNLTVSLLTTGKPLVAHNLPPLLQLLREVNRRVPRHAT